METIICHRTALSHLDRLSRTDERGSATLPQLQTVDGPISISAPKLADAKKLQGILQANPPYDVLVDEPSKRRNNRLVRTHLWRGPLPSGSLLRLDEDILICSIPLIFIQLAAELPFIRAIQLANSLTAIYSFSTSSPDGTGPRLPLATEQSLAEGIARFKSGKGTAAARSAMRFVIGNSRSPMESDLAAALSLPVQRGGFGLPRPLLNYLVPLEAEAQRLHDASHCKVDLYWPEANFGFEYDSRARHSGNEKHGNDVSRMLALKTMDIEIHPVTYKQMKNIYQLTDLARRVAEAPGSQARSDDPQARASHERLVRELLARQG